MSLSATERHNSATADPQVGDAGAGALPAVAGLCLKSQHIDTILQEQPPVGWFEVHAENYLGAGGAPLHTLERIRADYPLSVHGVGLSIGSAAGLDPHHLARVASLVERFDPESFSEHLAWSTHDSEFFSDLLPLPYNRQVEDTVCAHIDQIQSVLGRQMLLENPSNYLELDESVQAESEFIAAVVRRTGCGLLLDVNNVYVSAQNCGYSAHEYIDGLPLSAVGEIHLAGHAIDDTVPNDPLLIDAHDRAICDDVWELFAFTVGRTGAKPALIEWDTAIPEWPVFMGEHDRANRVMQRASASTVRLQRA